MSRLFSKQLILTLFKLVFAALLLYAVGQQIAGGLRQVERLHIRFFWAPLILSAALYAAGLACFSAYWRQIAADMGGRMGVRESQRAFFVSQLGKYIPGKAWVLLIRYGLTDRKMVPATVVVASSFYETLAVMAAGALFALVTLVAAGVTVHSVLILALGLAAGLTFLVHPWVFSRLVSLGILPFRRWGADPVSPVAVGTLLKGTPYLIAGWSLAGLSLVAAAGSVGIDLFSLQGTLLAGGSMALAMSGGFVVLVVPAGLGVREWILMQTLGLTVGAGNAALIAITARTANVATELVVAGGLYLFVRRRVNAQSCHSGL